jgi:hypothetical protein
MERLLPVRGDGYSVNLPAVVGVITNNVFNSRHFFLNFIKLQSLKLSVYFPHAPQNLIFPCLNRIRNLKQMRKYFFVLVELLFYFSMIENVDIQKIQEKTRILPILELLETDFFCQNVSGK